jgi:uncharacterized protein (DUF427 family)
MMWTYTGNTRPPFADEPKPGQESVWDYPRPPALKPDARLVIVGWRGIEIARSTRTLRVCETASPPVFYLPPEDVRDDLLISAPGSSFCEWKGLAAYWSVRLLDGSTAEAVGWSYPDPKSAFAAIAGWLSFYPGRLDCTVDGESVRPQAGGFYGGWVTDELAGPFKGAPGTGHW